MNAMTDVQNLNWALDNIYTDDDAARADARQIIVDLELAEYPEFGDYDDCDESNDLLRETIRQRARDAGYAAYLD